MIFLESKERFFEQTGKITENMLENISSEYIKSPKKLEVLEDTNQKICMLEEKL